MTHSISLFPEMRLKQPKNKGNNYFLYLLNRESGIFKIIQDPFAEIFESKELDWTTEPESYKVRKIQYPKNLKGQNFSN